MLALIPNMKRPWETKWSCKSGFHSNAPSGGTVESPLMEVLGALLLGALVGLILGFIISSVLRYLSIVLGRHIGGPAWTLYATLLGAILFGIFAMTRED